MPNKQNEYVTIYIDYLNKCGKIGWLKFKSYSDELNQKNLIIAKLALLHPSHFKKMPLIGNVENKNSHLEKLQKQVQGERTFKQQPRRKNCQSKIIWGYNCPFDNRNLVYDHKFPYSFGGPTDNANNCLILCHWHNMVKSNDIHCYDWENLFEDYEFSLKLEDDIHWLDEQIDKIIRVFNL
jgi:hypothetical protein